jgi:histidyl-tRNA synthetase
VGWAAGTERMLLAAGEDTAERPRPVFIAYAAPDAARNGFLLARRLREAGFRVESEQAGRSLKGQLKQADRVGAFATVILGDSTEVKDMDTGAQREADGPEQVLEIVREAAES